MNSLYFSLLQGKEGRDESATDCLHRQVAFRAKLIDAYESRCAITSCAVLPILEAAHITPYLGPTTNMVSNGLLLRMDIHTLWDLGLIAIEPGSKKVRVSPKVADDAYQKLVGMTAFQPKEPCSRASLDALKQQWELTQKELLGQQ